MMLRRSSSIAALLAAGCAVPSVPLAAPRAIVLPPSVSPRCVALEPDATALAAGTDGALWGWSASTVLRIDREGERVAIADLDEAPSAIVPLGGERFTAQVGPRFFTFDGEALEATDLPHEVGAPSSFCGAPSPGELWLAATERGWLRRSGASYELMTSDDDLLAHATVHPEPSGRCASGAPARWVFTDEGVARLDLFARTLALDPPRSPTGFSIRGHHYALVEEEMVWVRSPDVMHRYRIEGAAPRATALADDALWVVTDGGALRIARSDEVIDADPETTYFEGPFEAVIVDAAGGAWGRRASEVCRLEPETWIAVTGLVHDERVLDARTVRIETAGALGELVVSLDGLEIARGTPPFDVAMPLPGVGWHRLTVARSDGRVVRAVPFEADDPDGVRFASDLLPLLEAHCGECHGPAGPRRELTSFDAFEPRAERALERIAAGEMPPRPRPAPPAELATRIDLWIRGGMLP